MHSLLCVLLTAMISPLVLASQKRLRIKKGRQALQLQLQLFFSNCTTWSYFSEIQERVAPGNRKIHYRGSQWRRNTTQARDCNYISWKSNESANSLKLSGNSFPIITQFSWRCHPKVILNTLSPTSHTQKIIVTIG